MTETTASLTEARPPTIDTERSDRAKFTDPDWTAKGEPRARVPFVRLDTLWFNTGTLCNIECKSCYIESSPSNDRLVYVSRADVAPFLAEAKARGTREIGFTGGEPFLNGEMLGILEDTLNEGFEVLVLTNAMRPMQRPRIKEGLLALKARFGSQLTLRVSLDHHTKALHETERGLNTWDNALEGMDWLSENGFQMAIAGRTCWGEDDAASRAGYARLIAAHGWPIEPADTQQLMLLPEMNEAAEVPEITTACWSILQKRPVDMMCSTSRMVVKRRGAGAATVLPCTLIPYDAAFDMGPTLAAAEAANGGMFDGGAVKLCHVHCARFCVLGGGSCS
ncbi:MAG: radical SAM protein [Pseudomonadota bacterium]